MRRVNTPAESTTTSDPLSDGFLSVLASKQFISINGTAFCFLLLLLRGFSKCLQQSSTEL